MLVKSMFFCFECSSTYILHACFSTYAKKLFKTWYIHVLVYFSITKSFNRLILGKGAILKEYMKILI